MNNQKSGVMALSEMFNKKSRYKPEGRNPFKALDPYSEEESEKFFGRNDEVQSLYYHVKQNYLTVLYGESGVGKSSIINAGLVPLLRTKNIFPIRLRTSAILNEENPAKFILKQVIKEAVEYNYLLYNDYEGMIIDHESIEYLDKSLWEFFHQISFYKKDKADSEQFNANKNVPTLPLLIFDQFEEIFSAPVSSRKEEFLNELASLVENYPMQRVRHMDVSNEPPNCKILISLKSESMPKLGKLSSIIPSISQTRNKIMLDRLTDVQGSYIIDQVGNEKGSTAIFPKETINHIINEISSFDDLGNLEKRKVQPYFLSLYCHEVYDNVVNRKNKSEIQVSDLKNDTEVLKRFYDENTKHISRKTRHFLEKNLLNNGSRALFPKANLPPKHEKGFESLAARKIIRLITFGDNQYYEIAHDKLAAIINESHKKNEAARKTWRNVAVLLLVPLVIYVITLLYQREVYNSENELYKTISTSSKAEGNWFGLMTKEQQEDVVGTLKKISSNSIRFEELKRSYIAAIKAKAFAEENDYYVAAQLLKAALEIDENEITSDIVNDSVFNRMAIAYHKYLLDGEGYAVYTRDNGETWVITDKSLSIYDRNNEDAVSMPFHGNAQSQVEFLRVGNQREVPILVNNYRYISLDRNSSFTGGFPTTPAIVKSIADKFVFIGTYGGEVYYYFSDRMEKREILDTQASEREVTAITASDSYLAVSWADGKINVYRWDGNKYSSSPVDSFFGFARDMVFTNDDKLFYGSENYDAYLHEIGKPENDVRFVGHDDYITSVDYNEKLNQFMTTSSDNRAIIWDRNGQPIYILKHGGDVYDGELIGTDSIITVSKDKMLYNWQLVDLGVEDERRMTLDKILAEIEPLTEEEKAEYGIKVQGSENSGHEDLVSEQ